jgi:hypothetical protein
MVESPKGLENTVTLYTDYFASSASSTRKPLSLDMRQLLSQLP